MPSRYRPTPPPPPPRLSRDFTAASERLYLVLRRLEQQAEARIPPAPALKPLGLRDASLLAAVQMKDVEGITAAIKLGANPNINGGAPLQAAAEGKSFDVMKELVIRGAEPAIAAASLRAEQARLGKSAIDRSDAELNRVLRDMIHSMSPGAPLRSLDTTMLLNALEKQRADRPNETLSATRLGAVSATLKTLEDWQQSFVKDFSPIEILRQQQRILDELAELRREISPQKLDKPRLAVPKPKEP